MDSDIQFGDLEEATPDIRLRPDRNKHYAVAEVGGPAEGDLPIFVDLDVAIDMEEHALSDISVELGGVMLGGQFEDEHGQPFVLISDSLRAAHYESTKGSFKFTHDTWSEITRQREQFPDDLQMVGWYHTHPDWGVFLSGMDMFICDNFFNKSLDVALVIDPCRDDRGMFQWTGDAANRIRRTGGFFLVSSRFRQAELELIAAQLAGADVMADPRFRNMGTQSSPVVNIADSNSWQGVAVLGMLTVQFVILLLIACRLLFPSLQLGGDDRLAALEKNIVAMRMADQQQLQSEAQAKVLDRMLAELKGQPEGQFQALVETQAEAEHWKASAAGQLALQRELQTALLKQQSELKRVAAGAESLKGRLGRRIESLHASKEKLEAANKELKTKLAKYTGDAEVSEDAAGGTIFGVSWWVALLFGAAVLALAAVGVYAGMSSPRDEEDYPEAAQDAEDRPATDRSEGQRPEHPQADDREDHQV